MFRICRFITRFTLVTAYLATFAIVGLTAVYEQHAHWLALTTDYMPADLRNFIVATVAAVAAMTVVAGAVRSRKVIVRR